MNDAIEQRKTCARFGARFEPVPAELNVGFARNAGDGTMPINGLRHAPEGSATGWYIWAGEVFPAADDAFEPVCAKHLVDLCPSVVPYLGLAPGWRFLIADGYEDVWFDPGLLGVEASRP